MARTTSQQSWRLGAGDFEEPAAGDSETGDWYDLKSDLLTLLSQVEGHLSGPDQIAADAPHSASRTAHLRHQDSEPVDDRRRSAIASVTRAVNRFSVRERDENFGKSHASDLNDAIEQIRMNQILPLPVNPGNSGSSKPTGTVVETPILETLSRQLDSIERKLETQPAANKHQSAADRANLAAIETHLADLAEAIDTVARHTDRSDITQKVEAQIETISQQVRSERNQDIANFSARMTDIASAMQSLLQQQTTGNIEGMKSLARAHEDGLKSIEGSIRNIYDRMDQIEKSVALAPSDTEDLSRGIAEIVRALDENAGPALQEQIELTSRHIAELASKSKNQNDVSALADAIAHLQMTVSDGFDTRLEQVEKQLVKVGRKMGELGKPDLQLGPLEPQLRQLTARMDQTGEQLARIIENLGEARQPDQDFDARAIAAAEKAFANFAKKLSPSSGPGNVELDPSTLEKMGRQVAKQVSEDLSRQGGPDAAAIRAQLEEVAERMAHKLSLGFAPLLAKKEATLSQTSLSDLEERISRLLIASGKSQSVSPGSNSPGDLKYGRTGEIRTEPDDVGKFAANPQPAALLNRPVAKQNPAASTGSATAKNQPPARGQPTASKTTTSRQIPAEPKTVSVSSDDRMPTSPAEERQLRDKPFPPPELPAQQKKPAAERTQVPSPVRPVSSASPKKTGTPESASRQRADQSFDRNAFIEAARRAQQRRIIENNSEPESQSLIARAFARFRLSGEEPTTKGAKASDAPASVSRIEPALHESGKPIAAEPGPVGKSPAGVNFDMDLTDAGHPHDENPKSPPRISRLFGFLGNNKRTLSLAASLVGVSLLGMHFISQRSLDNRFLISLPAFENTFLAEQDASVSDKIDTDPINVAGLMSPSPTQAPDNQPFEPSAMIDPVFTGSIDPFASEKHSKYAQSADRKPTPVVAAIDEFATPRMIEPATSVERLELPPEAIGPMELRQAAVDGDPRAQFEVGAIYSEGKALEADDAAAFLWYRRAADQDFIPAQYRLAALYEHGTGHARDLEKAVAWYKKAANSGNRMAAHNLAALLAGGEFGTQDFASAARWFEKAARAGLTDSQFNLGMLHARGLGVPQNLERSFLWFSLAAQSGDQGAIKAREDVARALDATAIADISDEIAKFKIDPIDFSANFAPLGTWSSEFDPGDPIAKKEVIQNVQAVLNRLGFDVGSPDGLMGPRTSDAIKTFERGTGMSEVGQINARLLAVLASQPV